MEIHEKGVNKYISKCVEPLLRWAMYLWSRSPEAINPSALTSDSAPALVSTCQSLTLGVCMSVLKCDALRCYHQCVKIVASACSATGAAATFHAVFGA